MSRLQRLPAAGWLAERWSRTTAAVHLMLGALIGLGVTIAVAAFGELTPALLAGWAAAALSFVAGTWLATWQLGAGQTAELAVREDPSRLVAHALVLLGAVGSLLVVAFVLLGTHPARGGAELARVLLGVLAIGASWLLVHTVYWLGYARLYYTLPIGGLDFHPAGDERPQFSDFAYLAFTVGMTFQVSDTEVTTARLRRVVLGQALISFVFVAVVLAVTINVLAGLAQNG